MGVEVKGVSQQGNDVDVDVDVSAEARAGQIPLSRNLFFPAYSNITNQNTNIFATITQTAAIYLQPQKWPHLVAK